MEQTLGKRIMQHRKNLKLTQDKLAESLGVTAQAVSKWENDQSCPDIAMLPKLAQIFGTTVDSLLGSETQPVYEAEVVQPEEKNNGCNIHWDFGNSGKIGFAVGILLLGIQLFLSSYFSRNISFWNLLWPTALLIFGVWGLLPKFSFFRFGCFLFGGYFLLDKWELLPITLGSDMVFPMILILLGLSLLVDATRKPRKFIPRLHNHGKQNYNYIFDDDHFEMEASFGDQTQVITLTLLRDAEIDVCFGNYIVDLTQVSSVAEGCYLDINCSFGEITLLVPSRFLVQNTPTTAFASVEIKGEPDTQPEGTIFLEANISFGQLFIQYI